MHGQVSVDWHVADAALLLGEEHFLTPVRAENGRLETAIILLVDEGVGRFLAEDTRIFQALLLHSGLRHCVRYVDGQHLGEPVVTRLSHIEHALGVVATAGRRDEQRPSVVFDHDGREISPRRRIAQRPLGKRDAGRRAAHRGVVPIGTNHLPGRPILEADEHFRFIGIDAELMRKSFVNAALAGVRINRSPDCLTALRKRGQHMPIGRWLVDHGRRGPMQTNVILTGSAVPNADSAFSTPLQITPNVHLVIAWSPVVRDANFRRPLGIGLAVEPDRLLRCVK